MEKHNHKWLRVYYRKRNKERKAQDWTKIPDYFVCTICLEVRRLK